MKNKILKTLRIFKHFISYLKNGDQDNLLEIEHYFNMKKFRRL